MRKLLLRSTAVLFLGATFAACGARTGLPAPEPSKCVSLDTTAPIADLDVFTMIDASGSMDFETAEGITKWQAVRNALAAFFLAKDSAGIGAAVTFYPLVDPSIPESCFDDSACVVPGNCQKTRVCLPEGGDACETDEDCAAFPGDTCQKIGLCENDPDSVCLPDLGVGCSAAQGACQDLGFCENHYVCSETAYAEPVVDVGPLPMHAGALLSAIETHIPDGGTTTLPALGGAIARATQWAQENPGHKAIVVLATDGLPTLCDPALDGDRPQAAIQNLVDVAAKGVESGVQTFVFGVFGPDEQEEAAPNLDAIAKGGGTGKAFLISTADDVTDELLQALNEVRVTAKSCEFAIPTIDGELPDLLQLDVQITPPGGEPVAIPFRASAAGCHPETGGFHYDTDPTGPVPPSRVVLCPASCALFGTATERTVQLRVSCEG